MTSLRGTWRIVFPYCLDMLIFFILFICHVEIVVSSARIVSTVASSTAKYSLNDLAVTFSVDSNIAYMIDATKRWRHGLRTHIMLDPSMDVATLEKLGAPYDESYTVLPSFPGRPDSLRHVLAPMFAFEALRGAEGGFKWLLVGDADTVFVPRAVLQLLNDMGLSAEEPHMLTDFLVSCDYNSCVHGEYCPRCDAPMRVDPRCLPCNYTSTSSTHATLGGRTSTEEALCPCKLPEGCSRPRSNYHAPLEDCTARTEISAYGGAGIIYSVGLLKELAADPGFYAPEALRELSYERPYGDVALSELARLKGFGFTRLPPVPAPEPGGEPTPVAHNDRRFSSYSWYNDNRLPNEQLEGLLELERRAPGSLNQLVSYHVHGMYGQKFGSAHFSSYKAIVQLLKRSLHSGKRVLG